MVSEISIWRSCLAISNTNLFIQLADLDAHIHFAVVNNLTVPFLVRTLSLDWCLMKLGIETPHSPYQAFYCRNYIRVFDTL